MQIIVIHSFGLSRHKLLRENLRQAVRFNEKFAKNQPNLTA
ncbi:hypothetical protein HPSNAG_1878 [Glaesserella parasuis str. Nagasaki]|nr:hypothetical protein HPSNAG_1878 [Glaesserella parasuis str. Nagasaki]